MRFLLLLLAFAAHAQAADFVRTTPTGFSRGGAPYRFVGTNFWYGMNLGVDGASGDRARLTRELDRLKQLGVTNLRIVGMTEGPDTEPWRIVPAVQPQPGVFREEVLAGLDVLLSEMSKRGMTAVVVLGDFWPWSGGMAQYLRWAGASAIPYPPPAQGGDWNVYSKYTQEFYSNESALGSYREAVRKVVTRVNSVTHVAYTQDPTVLAWELANEPRGIENVKMFNTWIDVMSSYIKSLDANHLVTTGCEGETPWPATSGLDFVTNHSYAAIDYATIHIWATNWGWFDPANAAQTYDAAVSKMQAYFNDHLAKAKRLGKPMVVEEFGLGRDGGTFDPASQTVYRDKYYAQVFQLVLNAAAAGAPVAGVNFWAWAGEGRPKKPYGSFWKPGDPFIGDPPHEPQGWNSVYDQDSSTKSVIAKYAKRLRKLK
jgi:mannan endo-1,4-beta-mannosidase